MTLLSYIRPRLSAIHVYLSPCREEALADGAEENAGQQQLLKRRVNSELQKEVLDTQETEAATMTDLESLRLPLSYQDSRGGASDRLVFLHLERRAEQHSTEQVRENTTVDVCICRRKSNTHHASLLTCRSDCTFALPTQKTRSSCMCWC